MFEIEVRSRSRAKLKEALGPKKEKKHVAPSLSFKSKAERVFPSLKNTESDDPEFKKALQLATRCYQKINLGDEVEVNYY